MTNRSITSPPNLWDETAMEAAALDELLHTPGQPLASFEGPSLPAFYAVVITGPAPAFYCREDDPYGPPTLVYLGSCASARERAGRHRKNARRIPGLPISSLAMIAVATPSHASALWGEAALIARCSTPWNSAYLKGFGSKSLGRHRLGQKASAFRRCHFPQRSAEARNEAAHLQARVMEHLQANPGPPGGWPWEIG